jgi:hypothetical protein
MAMSMASLTRWGTLVGPGMNSAFCPGIGGILLDELAPSQAARDRETLGKPASWRPRGWGMAHLFGLVSAE